MHQEMMRYDEQRAREMEMAAAGERQMSCSCSPFGTIISRAIKGRQRNEREGRPRKDMLDYAMAYPPAQTYYVRPNARTITVTTNSNHHPSNEPASHAIPPPETTTRASPGAAAAPPPRASSGAAGNKPRKKKKKKRVAFAPESVGPPMSGNAPPPPQHAGHAPQHAAVAASSTFGGAPADPPSSVYHMQGAAEPYHSFPQDTPGQYSRQGGHGHGYGNYGRCYYAPSPLTRWDVARTPRRHEYFSAEYRWYYPTPVRESIYSFATDANHRLTATFSEENPNACTIV